MPSIRPSTVEAAEAKARAADVASPEAEVRGGADAGRAAAEGVRPVAQPNSASGLAWRGS